MRTCFLFSLALLSGCVTTAYKEPAVSTPTAQLNFKTESFDAGSAGQNTQTFSVFADEKCAAPDGYGLMATASKTSTAHDKPARIPAGKRIWLRVTYNMYSAYSQRTPSCSSLLSFVPEAGKQYEVYQAPVLGVCPAQLKDAATKASPPTLRMHASSACN